MDSFVSRNYENIWITKYLYIEGIWVHQNLCWTYVMDFYYRRLTLKGCVSWGGEKNGKEEERNKSIKWDRIEKKKRYEEKQRVEEEKLRESNGCYKPCHYK